MDAKKLHDEIATKAGLFVVSHPDHSATILRALSLLASVEDEDGIVRELREGHGNQDCDHCERDPVHYVRCGRGDCVADEMLRQQAAALIIAQREELASLKQHAEALDSCAESLIASKCGRLWNWPDTAYETQMKNLNEAHDAYRAAHPRTP